MLEIDLNPFPELQTERLNLRRITENDAPEVLRFRSDPQIMRYLDRAGISTLQEAREYVKMFDQSLERNEGITWGIALKGSEKLIGNIGLWRFDKPNHRAELGYVLMPEFWQKGIMAEALAAVLQYGFRNLKIHSVEANINPENTASRKLLEKLGFVQEAYFRENYYYQGKFLDSVILSRIAPTSENML